MSKPERPEPGISRRTLLTLTPAAVLGAGVAAMGTPPAQAASLSVTDLQWNLAWFEFLGYGQIDGVYGPITTRAVRRMQYRAALVVDGVAGPITQATLINNVKAVQRALGGLQPDGLAGPVTVRRTRAVQKFAGLPVTGTANDQTIRALEGVIWAR
ncbi:MAG: peptidoglycan-binding domain-containing protein [Propionibacteriaceae bacterium]|nr:peptidoglycan-binding domain-containing protein [Propionibacteriaceae bacterium]